jgi:hypothetical protein
MIEEAAEIESTIVAIMDRLKKAAYRYQYQ